MPPRSSRWFLLTAACSLGCHAGGGEDPPNRPYIGGPISDFPRTDLGEDSLPDPAQESEPPRVDAPPGTNGGRTPDGPEVMPPAPSDPGGENAADASDAGAHPDAAAGHDAGAEPPGDDGGSGTDAAAVEDGAAGSEADDAAADAGAALSRARVTFDEGKRRRRDA